MYFMNTCINKTLIDNESIFAKNIGKIILHNYGFERYKEEYEQLTETDKALLYYKNICENEYCLTNMFFNDNLSDYYKKKIITFNDKLHIIIKTIKYKLTHNENNENNVHTGSVLLLIFESIEKRLNTIC